MEEALPLTDRLNLETARITWPELERYFAGGRVIHVVAALDLIEVAAGFAADNSTAVQQWLSTQQISKLSDDNARDWVDRQPELWAVVVAPWVLVQERD
ncbi:MAG: DUF2288 domain-containing protein [Thiothrix sp.]|uniref:DUF2288 domain-containing protein n=1 Tax=Thiothrix sp. TaxID=1032 RepID=UPI0026045B61|nr:DUF2288 domain-containing protein [Thiothrix sp.]MDD5391376.1 DUF2288 domain-containing protein [Thiothrix sp.]